MKALLTMAVAVMLVTTAFGQTSYFNQGLLRQPSAAADLAYLGISSSGIPSYVVTNTQTGITLGGTFTGTFSGTYNTPLNGILQANGITMGTVTIGPGLTYVGTTLSAVGGSGTVTSFSSGNLSPLFTTSVATASTTPALSFALVSQNANLVYASPDGAPGSPSFRSLSLNDIPRTVFTNHTDVVTTTLQPGDIIAYDGLTWTNGPPTSGGASGTVTSFSAGNLSPLFTTSVATASTTPALTFAQVSQSANLFFASPDGAPGNPSFRSIVAADVPRDVFTNHSDVVPAPLQPGDVIAYSGTVWTNGPPASTGGGSSNSLPGLLVRPVQAAADGTLSAPTWPDMTTYYFDEEFDSWIGNTSGQFGKNRWTAASLGGGGSVINASSNSPSHYGVIELQSPTTAGNSFLVTSFGSTGILPYGQLRTTPNWMLRATFLLSVTNAGSVFRIGLIDVSYQSQLPMNSPSNCLWIRWDKRTSDGEFFSFEARRDAVSETNASTVRVIAGTWYTITMYSTNAATVLCQVNNETPVTMTNICDHAMCLIATDQGSATASRLWVDRISFMASSISR